MTEWSTVAENENVEVVPAGTMRHEIAGIREDMRVLTKSVAELSQEVEHLREDVGRFKTHEAVSVNDSTSIRPYERVVTFTDAQRILMAATLKHTETEQMLDAHTKDREQWFHTKIGIASLILGMICGLVIALGTIYEVFVGLSHSVLH